MTTQDTYTDRLSDYLDGELDAAGSAQIEAHLAGCEECRKTLTDLRLVIAHAANLQDAGPDADLWPGVAARLDDGRRNVAQFRAASLSKRFSFTMPQLVAAALALMVLSGSMVWLARLGGERTDFPAVAGQVVRPEVIPANLADAHFDEAISDLQQALESGRGSLDAETIRILEQNLQSIDDAIEQCRRALAADPANVYLNSHLAEAKKRKLALLRRATSIVAEIKG
jgi:tetratricopeptide (TPR) repeat protein